MQKQKPKLSVCILVLNGEKTIKNTLESVKNISEEIIVGIDSLTTDKTKEIAQRYTNNIFEVKHNSSFDLNKGKVVEKAGNEWVLVLDADESITPSLEKEISDTIQNPDYGVYKIARKNIIFNKWIKHCGWYPDYQIRLFKKGLATFSATKLHQHPEVKTETGILKSVIIHENYQTISQFIQRIDHYTEVEANTSKNKIRALDFVKKPSDEFIKRFISLEGYKDGLHGLLLSLLQAFYQLVILAKIWEKDDFSEKETNLNSIETEFENAAHDFKWWKSELKIRESKNSAEKLKLKLLRKANLL
ncbi:MAG: glycosyltransferase family 2 protein [Patescibacteria group bacterium]|jgi:glycosyltransferase involved in cell wall biosynthesis